MIVSLGCQVRAMFLPFHRNFDLAVSENTVACFCSRLAGSALLAAFTLYAIFTRIANIFRSRIDDIIEEYSQRFH